MNKLSNKLDTKIKEYRVYIDKIKEYSGKRKSKKIF